MKKSVQLKIKQRIETIEGLPTSEALARIYFVEMLTFRKICIKWNINTRTLMRLFVEYNLTPRRGSEAIKTQWINASDRRKNTSKKMSEIIKKIPPPMLGKKRPDAVIRMRKNNPMFNPEIRKKANQKTIDTYNANPEKRNIYHNRLTQCEQIVFDFCISKGFNAIGNELVNGRFVDIYLPEIKVCIECIGNRFPLSFDRHKQIIENNSKVIYCCNNFIKKRHFDILYDYITNQNIFSTFPPINSKETVIFGRRNGIVFDGNFNHSSIKTINMNGCNFMLITTSTDN